MKLIPTWSRYYWHTHTHTHIYNTHIQYSVGVLCRNKFVMTI